MEGVRRLPLPEKPKLSRRFPFGKCIRIPGVCEGYVQDEKGIRAEKVGTIRVLRPRGKGVIERTKWIALDPITLLSGAETLKLPQNTPFTS